jgi:hypothetical protein
MTNGLSELPRYQPPARRLPQQRSFGADVSVAMERSEKACSRLTQALFAGSLRRNASAPFLQRCRQSGCSAGHVGRSRESAVQWQRSAAGEAPGDVSRRLSGPHLLISMGASTARKRLGPASPQTFATISARSGHYRNAVLSYYSMISSAPADRPGGTSKPIAFAVLRLITNSNLVGSRTGRSAGLAPLRILPA